ncbi:MAG TPA: hypothetical protein VGM10_10085 [Actinocrinis sp.]
MTEGQEAEPDGSLPQSGGQPGQFTPGETSGVDTVAGSVGSEDPKCADRKGVDSAAGRDAPASTATRPAVAAATLIKATANRPRFIIAPLARLFRD